MTALPGLTPRSPLTTVLPVLVTVEPASTAKLCAIPRVGAVAADAAELVLGALQASEKAKGTTIARRTASRRSLDARSMGSS